MIFEYYPSEKKGLYCPTCVENEQWRTVPEPSYGPDNNRWNGGNVELECPICGDTFERHPGSMTDGTNLCSNECPSEWLSTAYIGDGHPNWKGGDSAPYGKDWNRVRTRALERDGYQCAVCSKTKYEIGRNPDVHHIILVRAFIESDHYENADAHRLDNVVSLCIDCHRKTDFDTIPRNALWSLIGVTDPELNREAFDR